MFSRYRAVGLGKGLEQVLMLVCANTDAGAVSLTVLQRHYPLLLSPRSCTITSPQSVVWRLPAGC
jgi:hypothetical protein